MSNCHCHTEISRDGSGQLSRFLKALDPSYAPIDGRSMEELLVFAKRYAAQIRFYDIPESNIDDPTPPAKISWKEFFSRDMPVIAASLALTDLEEIDREYKEIREQLELNPEADKFRALFDPILGMAVRIDKWVGLAIPENPLYHDLRLAIDSNLREQVKKIVSYEEGFKLVDARRPLKLEYGLTHESLWGLDDDSSLDATIYEGNTPEEKMVHAALFVDDIFFSFYGFLQQLVEKSESYLKFALESYPAHQPHMALFISFLQLFQLAQDQMNGLTGKILEFYYKDVLQFIPRPSIPDRVHMVFELAKDIAAFNLEKNTSLNAGKDASGKDQVYLTEDDLVINAAKVKELKTIFIEKTEETQTAPSIIKNIFARPVANSADGMGTPFDTVGSKWPSFGQGSAGASKAKNPCDLIRLVKESSERTDEARVGFGIASPQLLLQGGNRLITLRLANFETLFNRFDVPVEGGSPPFTVYFSGEKEWIRVDRKMEEGELERFQKYLSYGLFNPEAGDIPSAYYFDRQNTALVIYLPVAEQAVVPFDSKLHPGFAFATKQPVMQLLINPAIGLQEREFLSLTAAGLSIEVKVGSMNPEVEKWQTIESSDKVPPGIFSNHYDGLKILVIQNSLGLLPPDKPFDPFTAYPQKGRSFYIGSEEVFNKQPDELAINIRKTTEDTAHLKEITKAYLQRNEEYDLAVLKNRSWQPLATLRAGKPDYDFASQELTANVLFQVVGEGTDYKLSPVYIPRKPLEPVVEWTSKSGKGFIRITNIRQSGEDLQTRQQNAAAMEISEVSLSYVSILNALDPEVDQLFHIYPFGFVETFNPRGDKYTISNRRGNDFEKLDAQKNFQLVDAKNRLLPQFTYVSPYEKYRRTEPLSPIEGKRLTGNTLNNSLLHELNLQSKDRDVVRLMLSASGIQEVLEGKPNQYSGKQEEEGLLFIGIENAKPLQTLSLLFQFAEGSAEDEDSTPPVIHWSYLTNNEWRPMKEELIIHDDTFGFQATGIIRLEIPADATVENTIITNGLTWFCVSVSEHTNRFPQLIDVVAQAVVARYADRGNAPSHFDKVLPAGTIGKLSVAVAEVSKVSQPFASFDGKHQEAGKEFYTRVSERLRHKGRAINSWDYEHLVLNRYPSIYKVKCIPHTDPDCLCRTSNETPLVGSRTVLYTVKFDESSSLGEEEGKRLMEVVKQADLGKDNHLEVEGHGKDTGNTAKAEAHVRAVSTYIESKLGIPQSKIKLEFNAPGSLFEVTVYLVKEAPSTGTTDALPCCGPQLAPGHVLIVPISNLRNRNAVNPLQPKTPRRVLREIEAWLKKRTSPFVHIHARNPVYEQILVAFRVEFYKGTDKGFYMKKLNDEIVHYLTPWAFDENAEVRFDQVIYASSIINFIEERPYVDFITDFEMFVCRDACCPPEKNKPDEMDTAETGYGDKEHEDDGKDAFEERLRKIRGCADVECLFAQGAEFSGDIVARPSTPRSLLVSVPQHIIIPYEKPPYLSPCEKKLKGLAYTEKDLHRSSGQPYRAEERKAVSPLPVPAKPEKRSENKKEEVIPAPPVKSPPARKTAPVKSTGGRNRKPNK